jgi:hypothetical protein
MLIQKGDVESAFRDTCRTSSGIRVPAKSDTLVHAQNSPMEFEEVLFAMQCSQEELLAKLRI